MNFYERLGVERSATDAEIANAYRRKAAQAHPDNQDTGNEEEFRALTLIRDTLLDEKARQMYDATGQSAFEKPELPAAIQLIRYCAVECAKESVKGNLVENIRGMVRLNLKRNREASESYSKQLDEINKRWKDDELKGSVLGEFLERKTAHAAQVRVSEAALTLLEPCNYEAEQLGRPYTSFDSANITTFTW